MAQVLTSQADLDHIFKRMSNDFETLNKRQQAFAIREIGKVRGEIAEMLAEYSDDDGTIKRRRLSRILRELDVIERIIRERGEITLETIIEESAEWTARRIARGTGITLSQSAFDRVNENVINYVIRRFGEDGLVLSDRIWGLSGEIRDELSTVIRRSIIRGDSINSMIPQIRRVYENETWKIRRLARTESLTAFRAATGYNAAEYGVMWLQFHEGDDRSDACVRLAEIDKHGQGKGVYKPTDTEIWNPHPNCTSWVSYVLDERWL